MSDALAARVREAAAAWVHLPPDAPVVRTEEYLLVRYADHWAQPLELAWFRPRRDAGVVLDEALDRARELYTRVACWVTLEAPPGYADLLVARGGVLEETVDVLAADLTSSGPTSDAGPLRLDAPELDVRVVDDRASFVAADVVGQAAFGDSLVPDDAIDAEVARVRERLAGGAGVQVVAYDDGRAVGSAGASLVDGVLRLWGGATLPDVRGRGVYRALLAARVRWGLERGATLALVKGRVDTSGPILRRAGFTAYGEQTSYVVPLD